jgi:hypothetical protein
VTETLYLCCACGTTLRLRENPGALNVKYWCDFCDHARRRPTHPALIVRAA